MIKKYKKQAELLLSVLETSLKDNRFALKGGTAINLFYRPVWITATLWTKYPLRMKRPHCYRRTQLYIVRLPRVCVQLSSSMRAARAMTSSLLKSLGK